MKKACIAVLVILMLSFCAGAIALEFTVEEAGLTLDLSGVATAITKPSREEDNEKVVAQFVFKDESIMSVCIWQDTLSLTDREYQMVDFGSDPFTTESGNQLTLDHQPTYDQFDYHSGYQGVSIFFFYPDGSDEAANKAWSMEIMKKARFAAQLPYSNVQSDETVEVTPSETPKPVQSEELPATGVYPVTGEDLCITLPYAAKQEFEQTGQNEFTALDTYVSKKGFILQILRGPNDEHLSNEQFMEKYKEDGDEHEIKSINGMDLVIFRELHEDYYLTECDYVTEDHTVLFVFTYVNPLAYFDVENAIESIALKTPDAVVE